MSAEELKMILDAIASVSGNASNAAIWWMALHYGTQVIGHLLAAVSGTAIVISVARTLAGASEWARLGQQVAGAWGAASPFGRVMNDDRDAIGRAIAAAKEERKASPSRSSKPPACI